MARDARRDTSSRVGRHAPRSSASVEYGEEDFPEKLLVDDVVTLGTPFRGADAWIGLCRNWDQCDDLRTFDTFGFSDVQDFFRDRGGLAPPQGRGGTDWTLLHARYDCASPREKSTQFMAQHKVEYEEPLSAESIDCGFTPTDGDHSGMKSKAAREGSPAALVSDGGVRHYYPDYYDPMLAIILALGTEDH